MSAAASYKVEVIDRVFFLRWLNPPAKEDVIAIEEQMRVARELAGSPLIYIGVIGPKAKVPNADERNNLNTLTNLSRKYCEAAHVIIEGNDLQNSLQRVIISGTLIVTRIYDDYLSVHKTGDSVADSLKTRLKKDPMPILRQARAHGLIT